MKIVVFIWAMFLLSLGMAPCSHGVDLQKHDIHQTGQQGDSHSNDICNPFCMCGCYSTVVVVKVFFYEVVAPPLLQSLKFSFFNKLHSKLVCHSIWHPPVA